VSCCVRWPQTLREWSWNGHAASCLFGQPCITFNTPLIVALYDAQSLASACNAEREVACLQPLLSLAHSHSPAPHHTGWRPQDGERPSVADGAGRVWVSQQHHGVAVRVGVAEPKAVNPITACGCAACEQVHSPLSILDTACASLPPPARPPTR
jgi:hypothetical protein